MSRTVKELYEKIEIGKSYDMWTFCGYGNVITVKENDRNADIRCSEAENKGWAWFLYKDDMGSHPLHRRLIIIKKGLK